MISSLVSVNSQPAKKSCVTLAMTRIGENLYGQQSSTCASVLVDLRTMDTLLPPTRADPLALSFIFIGVLTGLVLTKEGTDPSLRSKRQALSVGSVAFSLSSHPLLRISVLFFPSQFPFLSLPFPALPWLPAIDPRSRVLLKGGPAYFVTFVNSGPPSLQNPAGPSNFPGLPAKIPVAPLAWAVIPVVVPFYFFLVS